MEEIDDDWMVNVPESGLICEKCGYTDSLKCPVPGWDGEGEEEFTILCGECASKEGYCSGCGTFCAGIDSFEFVHPGLCDNCYDEICSSYDDEDFED